MPMSQVDEGCMLLRERFQEQIKLLLLMINGFISIYTTTTIFIHRATICTHLDPSHLLRRHILLLPLHDCLLSRPFHNRHLVLVLSTNTMVNFYQPSFYLFWMLTCSNHSC